jgi:hypothetical protein
MARALALNASKELAAGGAGQLTAKIMPLPQWLLAVSGDQTFRKLYNSWKAEGMYPLPACSTPRSAWCR